MLCPQHPTLCLHLCLPCSSSAASAMDLSTLYHQSCTLHTFFTSYLDFQLPTLSPCTCIASYLSLDHSTVSLYIVAQSQLALSDVSNRYYAPCKALWLCCVLLNLECKMNFCLSGRATQMHKPQWGKIIHMHNPRYQLIFNHLIIWVVDFSEGMGSDGQDCVLDSIR